MDAFEQYTDLVNAASAIVNDTDARYEAFAKAEAYMLENVLVSPTYYDVAWSLTHANEYSKINAMYGSCNYKAVNWETPRKPTPPSSTSSLPRLLTLLLRAKQTQKSFHFS